MTLYNGYTHVWCTRMMNRRELWLNVNCGGVTPEQICSNLENIQAPPNINLGSIRTVAQYGAYIYIYMFIRAFKIISSCVRHPGFLFQALNKMKRELRSKMEREISDLQKIIVQDDEEDYFRELEVERLRRRVQMASFQYSTSCTYWPQASEQHVTGETLHLWSSLHLLSP